MDEEQERKEEDEIGNDMIDVENEEKEELEVREDEIPLCMIHVFFFFSLCEREISMWRVFLIFFVIVSSSS